MPQTFQGKPCHNGHSGIRYVSSKDCVECSRERYRVRKQKDGDGAPRRGEPKRRGPRGVAKPEAALPCRTAGIFWQPPREMLMSGRVGSSASRSTR